MVVLPFVWSSQLQSWLFAFHCVCDSANPDLSDGCRGWEALALCLQMSVFLSENQQLLPEGKELLRRGLKELLQRRQEEVALVRKEKKAIGTFLSMCRRVPVKGSVLGAIWKWQLGKTWFSLTMTGLCKQVLF